MHSPVLFVTAILATTIVAVQAGGSWCYKPKNEPFWGAASASCCNGWMGDDRRCHDIPDCRAFYTCCINKWRSGNKPTDRCT